MIKKSELYREFVDEFFLALHSDTHNARFDTCKEAIANNDIEGALYLIEQSTLETMAEIMARILARFDLIEDDVNINNTFRGNTILKHMEKKIPGYIQAFKAQVVIDDLKEMGINPNSFKD